MNMKILTAIVLMGLTLASCTSLTSTTYIKANDSFVLGNNRHEAFSVRLKNISPEDVEVHRAPISGGSHSFESIKRGQTVSIMVEKDCALVITNKAADKATVQLLVKGDTDLSMGYKNQ